MSLATSPPRKKTRHGITNIQRKALRDWYNDDSKDKVTQNDCHMWWKSEYSYMPGSTSISEILSSKYAYLDDKEEASSIKREVIPKWPVLQDALFECIGKSGGPANWSNGRLIGYISQLAEMF